MKTALLLNAVNPRIGGVLIRGEKGTAKSTAVRALAHLLPEIETVNGCAFSCDPTDPSALCEACRDRAARRDLQTCTRRTRVVDLPIGATEDRVVGTLDIEQVLTEGRKAFQPGVLAEANRGVLYVDEVNLLEDHIVDLLLDAAAMGVNSVQREGISLAHAARFVLVGTMNPEEGDLRPQLLDRFGLCAEVRSCVDRSERTEIVKRRAAWEADPVSFAGEWEKEERRISLQIESAVGAVESVSVDEATLQLVAEICTEMGVQGHRADITIVQASRTLAALEGRDEVRESDVSTVAPLCLTHRMRRLPFEDDALDEQKLEKLLRSYRHSSAHGRVSIQGRRRAGSLSREEGDSTAGSARQGDNGDREHAASRSGHGGDEEVVGIGSTDARPPLSAVSGPTTAGSNGKREKAPAPGGRGRYVGSRTPAGKAKDPAIDATLRAAASRGGRQDGSLALRIVPDDLRDKIRVRRAGAMILFCVDASGSMRARESMEAAKSAVLALLVDAYKRRDRVGMVAFRGKRADVLLPPTTSVEQAHTRLKELPTGGTTPLAHGLATSLSILSRDAKKESGSVPWLVLVTDGNANVPIGNGVPEAEARSMAACFKQRKINTLVIDTGRMLRRETLAKQIAEAAGGSYLRLEELGSEGLGDAVKQYVRH